MQIHRFITLLVGTMFRKARSTAFDLDTASRFLLDMFDICAPMTYNLCAKIEAWKWLQVDRNTFFGPFALPDIVNGGRDKNNSTYPSKFITFELFWFSAAETSFINKVRKLLAHQLIDFLNRLL